MLLVAHLHFFQRFKPNKNTKELSSQRTKTEQLWTDVARQNRNNERPTSPKHAVHSKLYHLSTQS